MNRGLIVLAFAVALAGCGGDDNDSSASENYANGVCADVSMGRRPEGHPEVAPGRRPLDHQGGHRSRGR